MLSQNILICSCRLNYLGDFGTQFGIVLAGLEEEGLKSPAGLESLGGNNNDTAEALKRLAAIYVKANARAESDPEFRNHAQELSKQLEDAMSRKEDSEDVKVWRRIRELTVAELEATYARIGIRFDEYHGEAMYADAGWKERVLGLLRQRDMLEETEDGRMAVRVDDGCNEERLITVVKSDGSSIYLLRDIAAVIDRAER